MALWTVAKARANFSALLASARNGEVQVVRQSGEIDVRLQREEPYLPLSYLIAGRAQADALHIVLAQREPGGGRHPDIRARLHLPDNLTGDVLRSVHAANGQLRVAEYVVTLIATVHTLQAAFGLPRSAASKVLLGLSLSGGEPAFIDRETFTWIERLAGNGGIAGDAIPLDEEWNAVRVRLTAP